MNLNGPNSMRGESLRMMDTAALRALLAMEMETDGELNIERIQEISDILAERDQITVPDVDQAWEDFQQNYTFSEPLHTLEQDDPQSEQPMSKPQPKRKRKKFFQIGVAVALLATLIAGASLTAHAANFDLWKAMAQWTSETFGFSLGDSESLPSGDMLDNEELTLFWNTMLKSGIPELQLPTYLPEGFIQFELTENSKAGFWCAGYQLEDKIVQIQVHRLQNEDWSTFQKNDVDPEVYLWNDTEFYVMENQGQWIASWSSGQYEYAIYGYSEPELYKMIESVCKEEP